MSSRFFTIVLSASVFFLLFFVFVFQPGYTQRQQAASAGHVSGASSVVLLSDPITLSGNKSFAQTYIPVSAGVLDGKDALKITYNLHGLCLLPGQSSEVALLSGENTHVGIELSQYGENCLDGVQAVDVPLSRFAGPVPLQNARSLLVSLWQPGQFTVDVQGIIAYFSDGSVLGLSTDPPEPMRNKTFPHITPIRPSPYVPYDSLN